jgi:hypothetical protein
MDEFFSQGEKERELGFDVIPAFDKTVASVPNIEMNFGEFFYFPLLLLMIEIFPSLEPMGRNLANNITNWAQLRINELMNEHTVEMKKLGMQEDAPLSQILKKEIEMLQVRGSNANNVLTDALDNLITYKPDVPPEPPLSPVLPPPVITKKPSVTTTATTSSSKTTTADTPTTAPAASAAPVETTHEDSETKSASE